MSRCISYQEENKHKETEAPWSKKGQALILWKNLTCVQKIGVTGCARVGWVGEPMAGFEYFGALGGIAPWGSYY